MSQKKFGMCKAIHKSINNATSKSICRSDYMNSSNITVSVATNKSSVIKSSKNSYSLPKKVFTNSTGHTKCDFIKKYPPVPVPKNLIFNKKISVPVSSRNVNRSMYVLNMKEKDLLKCARDEIKFNCTPE